MDHPEIIRRCDGRSPRRPGLGGAGTGAARVRLLALLVLFVRSSAPVYAQCDAFADPASITNWLRYDPIFTASGIAQNRFTLANGVFRLQANVSPDPQRLGQARVGALRPDGIYTNFYVIADLVGWNSQVSQSFGLVGGVRDLGPGRTDGYSFTYRTDRQTVFITRFTDELILSNLGTSSGTYLLDTNLAYRFVFTRSGDKLYGDIYELPHLTNRVLNIEATDPEVPSGIVGLLAIDFSPDRNSMADATFDNFCAMADEPARLSITPIERPLPTVELSWSLRLSSYVLESSPDLDSTAWIQEQTLSDGQRNHFIAETWEGPRFYRLRKRID